MKTLSEWNEYLESLRRLREIMFEGTKIADGITVKLSKEDCINLWDLLGTEANKVSCSPLELRDR